jgi:hypothetical protein
MSKENTHLATVLNYLVLKKAENPKLSAIFVGLSLGNLFCRKRIFLL